MARRDSAGVRLITRAGNDFSRRFPFISMAVGKLPVRSCLKKKGPALPPVRSSTLLWQLNPW